MTVKLIRMWSGEDVIAPWSPLVKKDKLEVVMSYVVYIADPQDEIIEQYNTMFGKISKPTKKLII